MRPLADALARVRALLEYRDTRMSHPAYDGEAVFLGGVTYRDLRTLLAALPTAEERQQINDAILCVDHVATDPASQRDPYRAHSWQHCAATIRNYLTRTGGATDGQ